MYVFLVPKLFPPCSLASAFLRQLPKQTHWVGAAWWDFASESSVSQKTQRKIAFASTQHAIAAYNACRLCFLFVMSVQPASPPTSPPPTVRSADDTEDMDFPIIRSARAKKPHALNEIDSVSNGFSYRRPHTPEKELANGANWVVQSERRTDNCCVRP